MGRYVLPKGMNFEEARSRLGLLGITLTRRIHKKGGYVCYANNALHERLRKGVLGL